MSALELSRVSKVYGSGASQVHALRDVVLSVEPHRRAAIASNHTATHLLNLALAQALGSDVHQKGSLVAPEKLRFDFSHPRPVAPEELVRIENAVRENVKADLNVFA